MAAGQNWDQAVSMLDLLLSRPASDAAAAAIKPGAAELKRKVDLERRSAEIFASFQEAVAAREPDVALSRFEQIPEDSVYKARAVPAMPGVKALFTAAHLDLAEASRTQGQCDEAVAEAEKIRQVDPENRRAADIVKKCRTHAQGRAAPAPSPSPPRAEPAARPAKPTVLAAPVAAGRAGLATATASVPAPALAPEPGAAAGEADLIRQAREAWLHQQCGAAVELSRRALKLKPAASEAYQIIAVCSCSMKDRDGALKAYGKLDERNRAMVRSLCARNGLDLAE